MATGSEYSYPLPEEEPVGEAFEPDQEPGLDHLLNLVPVTEQYLEEEDSGEPEGVDEEPKESSTTDTLQIFMNEIGKVPLLTAFEEVELAKRIEAGYLAQKLLDKKIAREPIEDSLLEEATKNKLISKITKTGLEEVVEDGQRAKDHMIEANLRLVVSIAKNYLGHGVSFQDLIQEGTLGLNRAAEKFDHHKGFKFSTYATWWIRQAVARSVANHSNTIRIPVHVYERVQKILKATRELTSELGRHPTEEEIAEATNLPKQHIQEAKQALDRQPISLNKPLGEDNESELGDLIDPFNNREITEYPDYTDTIQDNDIHEEIEKALEALSEREREIIQLRHGLIEGEKPMTLDAIGKNLGITRERVRQIENRALKKLAAIKGLRLASLDPENFESKASTQSATDPIKLSKEAKILQSSSEYKLIDVECRILEYMVWGFNKKGIARALGLAENTVKAYFSTIYQKIEVSGPKASNKAIAWAEEKMRNESGETS